MGQKPARRPPTAAPHSHMYLVVGNPPIRYVRRRRGPLLFHVEVPNTPDTVTKSETLECPVILSSRDLVVTHSVRGELTLHVGSVLHCEPHQRIVSLNVYMGTSVTFHPQAEDSCLRLEPIAAGKPFQLLEHIVRGDEESPLEVLREGLPLPHEAASAMAHNITNDASDPLARRHANFVITVCYADNLEGAERLYRYVALLRVANARNAATESRIGLTIDRQYLQLGAHELFDLEGLFGDDATSPDQRGESAAGAEEEGLCIVCWTEPVDTTCIPCRHYCLCSACAAEVKRTSNKCPCCRRSIDRLMRR